MRAARSVGVRTALMAVTAIGVTFTGVPASAQGTERTEIAIATSGQGSSFYPLSVALADAWTRRIENLNVSLAPGGGVASVVAVGGGEAEVGMTLSTAAVDGRSGNAPFPEAYQRVQALASLDPQAIQYLAYKESGMERFEEIAGKRVYVNPRNFSAHGIGLLVMSAHGIELEDLRSAETVGKSDAINLLKDGHLDALLWMGPVPDSLILDASLNRPIQLLEITEDNKSAIRQLNPGIVPYVIPEGTYPGVQEEFETLAVPRVLVVDEEMPGEIVYELVKVLVEAWEDLKLADPALGDMERSEIAIDFGVPYHPGAERYYRERGWMN